MITAAVGTEVRLIICLCLLYACPSFAAWQSPEQVEGTTRISTEEARNFFDDDIPFIDVRSQYYYNKRHIPGAYHLDLKNNFTEDNLEKIINKNEPAVIYCNGVHCSLSYRASAKAVEWGFTHIYYYREGFRSWRKAGHPIEVGDNIMKPQ